MNSTCKNGACEPSKDSAVRSPVPLIMIAIELPLDQPGRFTISWITKAMLGVL